MDVGKDILHNGVDILHDGKNILKDGKNIIKVGEGVINIGATVVKAGANAVKAGANAVKNIGEDIIDHIKDPKADRSKNERHQTQPLQYEPLTNNYEERSVLLFNVIRRLYDVDCPMFRYKGDESI